MVLKELKAPGIPVLYDCRDDGRYIWVIEEYVEGISLAEYLSDRDNLTLREISRLLIMICDIVGYLHSLGIIYRDLKPDNLILRGDELILIDYGAAFFKRADAMYEPYGTPGYSAPELFRNGKCDERSDIYSIGVIANELLSHTKGHIPYRLKYISAIASAKEAERRPKDVAQVKKLWEKEYAKQKKSDGRYLIRKITVCGLSHSCGTTHIAMSLVVYLNSTGMSAYYYDTSDSDNTRRLLRGSRGFCERDMIVRYHDFVALLSQSDGLEQPTPPKGIRIEDAGCDISKAHDADLTVLIAGSRPWQERGIRSDSIESCDVILINPPNRYAGGSFAFKTGRKVYAFPVDRDPFYLSKEKRKLFGRILKKCLVRKPGFIGKRH